MFLLQTKHCTNEVIATSFLADISSHRSCDAFYFRHQLLKHTERERLLPIRVCLRGLGMNFHDQSVGSGGNRCTAHRYDEIVPARTVTRIDDDRQMRKLFY